jgi:hypothetical protein
MVIFFVCHSHGWGKFVVYIFVWWLLKLDKNGKISHALLAPNLVKAQEKKRLYPTLWGLDDISMNHSFQNKVLVSYGGIILLHKFDYLF